MNSTEEISFDELNGDAFVARLRAKDAQAFRILFSRIVPKLCAFLSRDFKLDERDAEEVAADTMVKVYKSVVQFNPRGGAKLTTWIFRVAKNTAIDHTRQQASKTQKLQNVPFDETASKQVQRKAAQQWLRSQPASDGSAQNENTSLEMLRMNRALSVLTEQDRNLLLMKQNMKYEEIAEVEKVSVATLRTRHSRAMEHLRNELTKE